MDQTIINDSIRNFKMLQDESNSDLKDLIINMTNDDFSKRYSCVDVINHRWFQRNCL